MSKNAHGLEPTPEAAFQKMEKVEAHAYRTRTRLQDQLERAKNRRQALEDRIDFLEDRIRIIGRSIPSWGREIE